MIKDERMDQFRKLICPRETPSTCPVAKLISLNCQRAAEEEPEIAVAHDNCELWSITPLVVASRELPLSNDWRSTRNDFLFLSRRPFRQLRPTLSSYRYEAA